MAYLKRSPEWCAKISAALLGRKQPDAVKQKIRKTLFGRPRPDNVKAKLSKTHKRLGTRPPACKYKGKKRPIPTHQKILLDVLGKSWVAEFIVLLPKKRWCRIDVANPKQKLAIECDGWSHATVSARERDENKDMKLRKLGWKVLRISNSKVMELRKTKTDRSLKSAILEWLK